MRFFGGFAGLLTAASIGISVETTGLQKPITADPLTIARVLATNYPAQPIMSYIPALTWSSSMALFRLTSDSQWREKSATAIKAFTSGATPAIAEPYRLTSFAGALALADAGILMGDEEALELARKVAAFIMPDGAAENVRFATGWTDDMFMTSAVISRVGTVEQFTKLGTLLTSYADKLQRPDGLYIHATDGPHAWGRGNGFALLGVTEALTYLPENRPERPRLLEIYRKHAAALATLQSDDGSWRQVLDEPASYRELTVTAMTTAAIARGIRRDWLDRATYAPVVERGWAAVASRVNPDGTVRDVCSGTGVGPTKDYYLNRPVVNGADDRGGAMALLASIEVELLRRSTR